MGMHLDKKTARRTFTAKCGHKIEKGETYVTFTDYMMWNRVYTSSCVACHNESSMVKLVDGRFVLSKPAPLVPMNIIKEATT